MALVRGQWYQWKVHPNEFYRVSFIGTYIQLYPFDSTKYQVIYVTPAYLQANFRLLITSPQNFLIDANVTSESAVTRADVVKDKVVWGSVTGKVLVSQSHALLDTTLRAKVWQRFLTPKSVAYLSAIQARGSVQAHSTARGSDFTA